MTLAITISQQIKAYNLAVCPTLPEFMETAYKTQKSLKKNDQFKRRIEVIQGFEFNTACTQIEESLDQQYIIAAGLYAPCIKIYETAQLSLKCSRGLDSEIVKFCMLGEDYKKLAMVCEDRNIELHAQYGKHFKIRVPKQPTDMIFNPYNCDLLVSAQHSEVYRLNLETGSFVQPYLLEDTGANCLGMHDELQLGLVGGNKGLSVIDFKSGTVVQQLGTNSISSIASQHLQLAVGTQEGQVKLYDLRKQQPMHVYQHQYRLPIKKIVMNDNMMVSCDAKIMKFWKGTQLFTNIEPQTEINSFTWIKNSGMFLVALEQPRMGIYFVPQLSPAPKWCPFLDNLTEEMEEEEQQTVYDEYKFLTYEELEKLEALHLLETAMLKPYLHGYLIHLKLYLKLREQKGLDFDDFKQKRAEKHFQKLLEQERASKGYVEEKPQQPVETKQIDPRFGKLLSETDFKVDRKSEAWRRAHPSELKGSKKIHKK